MEPVSVIGLTASLFGCVNYITSSINSLLNLQIKYRQANFTVQLFLGHLSTLRAALKEVDKWISVSLNGFLQHEQLVSDLTTSIEGCQVLLSILSDRIASLDRNGMDQDGFESLSIRGKTRLLWAEAESNQYLSHLNNQISALNLLLTAFQCRSVHDQNVLLQNDESRHIMHLVKDDTSSLLWLRDADSCLSGRQSMMSESSTTLEVSFEFDHEVFSSKAYQSVIRSALSKRRGKPPLRQGPPWNDAIGTVGDGRSKGPGQADDVFVTMREGKGKMPQRQESPLNDVIDLDGSARSNDTEDDAQTIRRISLDLLPFNDATDVHGYARSDETENNVQIFGGEFAHRWSLFAAIFVENIKDTYPPDGTISINTNVHVEESTNPMATLAASNAREEKDAQQDLSTDKRRHVSKGPVYTSCASAMNNTASVKLGVLPSLPITMQNVHKSMSTADINSQSSSSPVARKVLLLGSSGAGKSTLLRSMTYCHEGTQYSPGERGFHKMIIYINIIEDIRMIFEAMANLGIDFDSKDNYDSFRMIARTTAVELSELSDELVFAIKACWNDSGVQRCFRISCLDQLNDPCGYFFDNIDRITSPEYIPTHQDVFRLHLRTTNTTKKSFEVGKFAYNLYDICSRPPECRKWRNFSADTDVVFFLVDISAYDRRYCEGDMTSAMTEVFLHFYFVCNNGWFAKTSIILFFTKIELLQRKLAVSPFNEYFVGFDGDPLNLEDVKSYLATKFLSIYKGPRNNIQVCFATMTCEKSLGKTAFTALEKCMELRESINIEPPTDLKTPCGTAQY